MIGSAARARTVRKGKSRLYEWTERSAASQAAQAG